MMIKPYSENFKNVNCKIDRDSRCRTVILAVPNEFWCKTYARLRGFTKKLHKIKIPEAFHSIRFSEYSFMTSRKGLCQEKERAHLQPRCFEHTRYNTAVPWQSGMTENTSFDTFWCVRYLQVHKSLVESVFTTYTLSYLFTRNLN